MSKPPTFPIYTLSPGCGHQHQTPERAENCARSALRADRTLTFVDVVERDGKRERIVGRVERER